MTIKVLHAPGSCSRVTLNALEEIGAPYDDHGVALMRGEQRELAYLAINPKGKVPVLLVDGEVFTETPVIIQYLATTHPEARLLPTGATPAVEAQGLSDLVWCAGALHPISHRLFRPDYYTEGDPAWVKQAARRQLGEAAVKVQDRLRSGPWWYGADWSIVDVYLAWIFSTAGLFEFPLPDYPVLAEHILRLAQRPAFQRALQRERDAITRDQLPLPPGVTI